jgi:hypothetical protein
VPVRREFVVPERTEFVLPTRTEFVVPERREFVIPQRSPIVFEAPPPPRLIPEVTLQPEIRFRPVVRDYLLVPDPCPITYQRYTCLNGDVFFLGSDGSICRGR